MSSTDELLHVKPGNAIRLVAIFAQLAPPTNNPNQPPSQSLVLPNGQQVTVFGTLFNPPGPLIVIVNGPNATQFTAPAPTLSDTGVGYVDVLIPIGSWPGKWQHRWYQQGAAVDANFLQEDNFWVDAPDF